jgi:hypothetical protein
MVIDFVMRTFTAAVQRPGNHGNRGRALVSRVFQEGA